MKKIISALLALTVTLSCGSAFAFTDMADSENSLLLERLSVISGYEDGSFRPDNNVTRAEAITIVMRALDISSEVGLYQYESMMRKGMFPEGTKVSDFADYNAQHWANAYIQAGITEGLISGFEDNTFRPSENVTLEQLFVMTLRPIGYGDKAASSGGYPDGYVKYAKSTRLTDGITAPYGRAATRREVMDCVANMLRAPLSGGGSYLAKYGYIYEAEVVVNSVTERDGQGNRRADVTLTSSDYAGSKAEALDTSVTVPYNVNVRLEEGKKYKMYINCYDENKENGYVMVSVPIE